MVPDSHLVLVRDLDRFATVGWREHRPILCLSVISIERMLLSHFCRCCQLDVELNHLSRRATTVSLSANLFALDFYLLE